jgi:large subunit ribosomal protein L22
MISSAYLRQLRIAPRKVRAVADLVRGKPVGHALNLLRFTSRAAALPLAKLLRSAVANAQRGDQSPDVDRLVVASITVDQGPSMKRFMPRAMGRASKILKKTSHVSVVLDNPPSRRK